MLHHGEDGSCCGGREDEHLLSQPSPVIRLRTRSRWQRWLAAQATDRGASQIPAWASTPWRLGPSSSGASKYPDQRPESLRGTTRASQRWLGKSAWRLITVKIPNHKPDPFFEYRFGSLSSRKRLSYQSWEPSTLGARHDTVSLPLTFRTPGINLPAPAQEPVAHFNGGPYSPRCEGNDTIRVILLLPRTRPFVPNSTWCLEGTQASPRTRAWRSADASPEYMLRVAATGGSLDWFISPGAPPIYGLPTGRSSEGGGAHQQRQVDATSQPPT